MKKTPFILAAMVILLTGNALFAIPPFPPGGGSVSVHDAVTLSGDPIAALFDLTTQALSLKTQSANKIFAGPASGADAAPGFRDMVADDLPNEISCTLSGFYTISGTTDGDGAGDGTTVVDATTLGSYANDWFNGGTILITSGTYSGVSKTISDFATTSGTVTVSEAFAGQIVSGVTYKIMLNNTLIVANSSGEATQGYPIFGGPTKPRKYTLPDQDASLVSEGAATGGVIFGDSSPDAAGEVGYGSGKFLMYGANSEDFYFEVGSAANTVTAGSNTSVTDLSLGAINLLTTGTIAGRVPIGSDITGNISLNTTDLIGKVYFVTAACTITLDKVSDVGFGAVVGFYVRDVSETVTIEVDDADKIKLYGTALAAGNTIDSPGAAGDYIFLMSVTDADGSGTDGWITFGGSGTWTDGGAT